MTKTKNNDNFDLLFGIRACLNRCLENVFIANRKKFKWLLYLKSNYNTKNAIFAGIEKTLIPSVH